MILSKLLNKPPKHALAFLLFIGVSTLTVTAQNERITLDSKSLSAGKVMRSIEAQTNFRIAYSYSTLDTTSMVNLPGNVLTVREALDSMVADKSMKYVLMGSYVAFVPVNNNNRSMVHTPANNVSNNAQHDVSYIADPRSPTAEPLIAQATMQFTEKGAETPPSPAVQYSAYKNVDRYASLQTSLPRFAIKSNLLYAGVALAPNLSFEFATAPRQTIEVSGSYNGWRRDDNNLNKPLDTKQLVHSIFRAEYRWWLCERYNGHFFGAHAFYSRYHISAKKVPLLFDKDKRYKGDAYGVGATYGYNLLIHKRWGLEFNIGLGVAYLKYDRYTCAVCDRKPVDANKWYVGPTRAGVTLVFHLK